LALGVALLATACDRAIIDYALVLATEHAVEAHVTADPGTVCPGELVLVEWNGGTDPPECADTRYYSASCKQPLLNSTGDILESRELTGSERVPIYNRTTFDFSVLRSEEFASDRAVVNVVSGEEGIPLMFGEECGADGFWQWTLQSPSIASMATACMSVTQVCAYGEPGSWVYVSKSGGSRAPMRSGTCTPLFNGKAVNFDAMYAEDLDGERRRCGDAQVEPGPESMPRDPIQLVVTIACPGPDDPAPEGCERVVTEALTFEPGGPSDEGLATFCNLEETCGDGVCDEPCEDAEFCAEDCQPEGGAPVCGDGTRSGDEECEVDEDCEQEFFCGDPGTNAPCLCVSNATEQSGDGSIQYFPVYDCVFVGGDTFEWYGANVTLGPDGEHLTVEYVDGPHQGGWRGFCPAGGEPNKPPSEGGPSCDPQQQQC
jgi:hypothetical protein